MNKDFEPDFLSLADDSGHSVVFQGLSRLTLPATAQSLGLGSCLWQGLLLELQRQGNTANLPADGINATVNSMAPIKMPNSGYLGVCQHL